jgi:hypothetical protein
MDMIRQGHLQEPNWRDMLQLCFLGGTTFDTTSRVKGRGSSCDVFEVQLEDGRRVSNRDGSRRRAGMEWLVAILSPILVGKYVVEPV